MSSKSRLVMEDVASDAAENTAPKQRGRPVLALASGFQQFGFQPKPVRKESPTLRPDKVWRIPPRLVPKKPLD